jgi:short-chain fatty acids transporter
MAELAKRWVPDPFVLALILTIVTLVLALVFGKEGFGFFDSLGAWGGRIIEGEVTPDERGFWKFLAFAMQMCLVLVTGHALATTKPVSKALFKLASIPKSTAQAASLTAFIAILAAFINWGLGLIVGAILAREIGKSAKARSIPLHYPLVAAAGYVGLMVWHGGFSGTAPFMMTQEKDVVAVLGPERAASVQPVGLDQTVLSPLNLIVAALLIVIVPLLFLALAPSKDRTVGIEIADIAEAKNDEVERGSGLIQALERTPLLTIIVCAMGFTYLYFYLSRISLWRIDINAINMFFLFLGLLLHGGPAAYVAAVGDAAKGAAGIILQFPFYAGIQAMLEHSGLIKSVSLWIAEHSSAQTLPLFTFFSAAIVNFFVPSGGGQWGIQGPVVVDSAVQLGAPIGSSIMALAYGDQWTNMLQPFWALPLLSITGLKAKDIIGYTALVMLLSLPIFAAALYFGR